MNEIGPLLLKALVTICTACLVTVHVLRIFPVEAPVADGSVKNCIEVIETATQDKWKFDVLAVDVTYKFV